MKRESALMEDFNSFLLEAQKVIPIGTLKLTKATKNKIEFVDEYGHKIVGRKTIDKQGYVRWAFKVQSS